VLNKDYVKKNKEPFSKYKSITKEDWVEFKRYRKSRAFKRLSRKQKKLVALNTNHHNMGVAGYYGMTPVWKEYDESCVSLGSEKPFSDVLCKRSRNYLLARSKLVDGKYVLQKPKFEALHKEMVSFYLLKLCKIIFASPTFD